MRNDVVAHFRNPIVLLVPIYYIVYLSYYKLLGRRLPHKFHSAVLWYYYVLVHSKSRTSAIISFKIINRYQGTRCLKNT